MPCEIFWRDLRNLHFKTGLKLDRFIFDLFQPASAEEPIWAKLLQGLSIQSRNSRVADLWNGWLKPNFPKNQFKKKAQRRFLRHVSTKKRILIGNEPMIMTKPGSSHELEAQRNLWVGGSFRAFKPDVKSEGISESNINQDSLKLDDSRKSTTPENEQSKKAGSDFEAFYRKLKEFGNFLKPRSTNRLKENSMDSFSPTNMAKFLINPPPPLVFKSVRCSDTQLPLKVPEASLLMILKGCIKTTNYLERFNQVKSTWIGFQRSLSVELKPFVDRAILNLIKPSIKKPLANALDTLNAEVLKEQISPAIQDLTGVLEDYLEKSETREEIRNNLLDLIGSKSEESIQAFVENEASRLVNSQREAINYSLENPPHSWRVVGPDVNPSRLKLYHGQMIIDAFKKHYIAKIQRKASKIIQDCYQTTLRPIMIEKTGILRLSEMQVIRLLGNHSLGIKLFKQSYTIDISPTELIGRLNFQPSKREMNTYYLERILEIIPPHCSSQIKRILKATHASFRKRMGRVLKIMKTAVEIQKPTKERVLRYVKIISCPLPSSNIPLLEKCVEMGIFNQSDGKNLVSSAIKLNRKDFKKVYPDDRLLKMIDESLKKIMLSRLEDLLNTQEYDNIIEVAEKEMNDQFHKDLEAWMMMNLIPQLPQPTMSTYDVIKEISKGLIKGIDNLKQEAMVELEKKLIKTGKVKSFISNKFINHIFPNILPLHANNEIDPAITYEYKATQLLALFLNEIKIQDQPKQTKAENTKQVTDFPMYERLQEFYETIDQRTRSIYQKSLKVNDSRLQGTIFEDIPMNVVMRINGQIHYLYQKLPELMESHDEFYGNLVLLRTFHKKFNLEIPQLMQRIQKIMKG